MLSPPPTVTATVTSGGRSEPVTEESTPLHKRCRQLHRDWKEAEFARMVQDYGATVNTISGSVGPLYYCAVKIEGKPTRAMVDGGSSVTVLNFSTFRELGKRAQIPPSALKPPDVPIRDYTQCPILVGAMVELEIEFKG